MEVKTIGKEGERETCTLKIGCIYKLYMLFIHIEYIFPSKLHYKYRFPMLSTKALYYH